MTNNIQNTILEIINHLVEKHPEFSPLIKKLLESKSVEKEFIPKFTEIIASNHSRNAVYDYMDNYFHKQAPDFIRLHRNYFKINNRGFGEDSFHSMWIMLMNQYKPKNLLEIGIYRGQTITLWGLISKFIGHDVNIHGISPFSSIGDRNSTYLSDLDYLEDTLLSHKYFDLEEPKLLKALSNEPLAKDYIKSKKWDLIYIDGSHDYEIALSDYEVSLENLLEGGLLIMDDSSLYTDYIPSKKSFKGHPGPSRVVIERAMDELFFLGGVGHNNVFIKK
jgi:hypothetical protein